MNKNNIIPNQMGLHIMSKKKIDGSTLSLFNGSYVGFFRLRRWVAERFGLKFRFEQTITPDEIMKLPMGAKHFFWHSDYEGEWTVEECRLIAELLKPLVVLTNSQCPYYNMCDVCVLYDGLEKCVKHNSGADFW